MVSVPWLVINALAAALGTVCLTVQPFKSSTTFLPAATVTPVLPTIVSSASIVMVVAFSAVAVSPLASAGTWAIASAREPYGSVSIFATGPTVQVPSPLSNVLAFAVLTYSFGLLLYVPPVMVNARYASSAAEYTAAVVLPVNVPPLISILAALEAPVYGYS